jgi:hypothetical protein
MSFLAPALLAGLLAIAVPVLVHLAQRERRRVVVFPSLMFVRKIPYRSVRRRVVRDWPLLLLRAAAVALFVLAFARPFVPGAGLAAAGSGTRDLVILLDRSASMAYGDRFARARDVARQAVQRLGPGDRASLVLFASDVEVAARPTTDHRVVLSALAGAAPVPLATHFGPALRAAAGLIEASPMPRREVMLVSDFQRTGWDAAQPVTFAPGITLNTASVALPEVEDAAIVDAAFDRAVADPSGGERVTITVRVANRGRSRVEGREAVLEADGRRVGVGRVSIDPGTVATVAFDPLSLPRGTALRIAVRLTPDRLSADDAWYAVLASRERLPVLVLEGADATGEYLRRALAVSIQPRIEATFVPAAGADPAAFARSAVIVVDDAAVPGGAAGRALAAAVDRGAGLLAVLGGRAQWPSADLLPGVLAGTVDRPEARGGSLGFVDFTHPLFEVFKAPRSGDLAAARVFRYRSLGAAGRVLARFDDGAVAVAERQVGKGKVIAWSSSLDGSWNDLVLQPVFVPFLHQAVKYLAGYTPRPAWQTAGEPVRADETDGVVLSPSGAREPSDDGRAFVPHETGFYERRTSAVTSAGRRYLAVNLDPAESNLATIDAAELAAQVSGGRGGIRSDEAVAVAPEDREHRQSLWWYALAAAVLMLAAESLLGGRVSRRTEAVGRVTT